MKNWVKHKVIDFCYVTDFVANGSFASLRENVSYLNAPDYAVLVRLTDFTKKWNKGFVYVSKASFDFLKKSSLFPNDLVMSNVGEPGIVFLVPDLKQPMTLGPNSILIRPNENSSTSKFIYLYFLSEKGKKQIDDISTGAAQKKFNKTSFRDLEISLPPLSEQQRIVSILDEAFSAISKAKANAEQNLKNAKQLFESYLQSVFENKGEGWEEKPLGEFVNLVDSLHQTPKYTVEGFPMVRVTDIKPGYLNLSKTKKVDKNTFEEFSKKHKPQIGDIVFSRVGSYGVSAIVNANELFCLGQNTVFILPKINANYLYYFLNSPSFRKQLDKKVAGTTQPTVSLKSIREVFVPVYSATEQQTIVKKLDELSTETKKLEAIYQNKIQDLEELKKSILQKAFSGELKTSKAVAV